MEVEIVSSALRSGSVIDSFIAEDGPGDSSGFGVDVPDAEGEGEAGVGVEGSDDTGTPRISARAAGEDEASLLECRCLCRDLPVSI